MAKLTEAQVNDGVRGLPGWRRRDDVLEKTFEFETFADAMAFVVRVAFGAEAADHHPDIRVHYRAVTLVYWTHTDGGITGRDLRGAEMVERIAVAHPVVGTSARVDSLDSTH